MLGDVSSLDPMPDAPEGTLGVLGLATAGQEIDAVVRFCKAAIARYRDAGAAQEAPVAVLFRSKSHMPEYQEVLEKAGLTTFVVGYSALLERPEIRDVLALLHVVADHTDTGALMRLLATPRFGLSSERRIWSNGSGLWCRPVWLLLIRRGRNGVPWFANIAIRWPMQCFCRIC